MQIEERQKLLSSSGQPSASIGVDQLSEPKPSISQSTVEVSEASSSTQTAPSETSDRSGSAVAQPYSPGISMPDGQQKESTDFHSDHGRVGTAGNVSEMPQPAAVEAEAASPSEAEKPPPLAGPNVMNVIVVAAECAPWSKTG